jgi:hypothetical protein
MIKVEYRVELLIEELIRRRDPAIVEIAKHNFNIVTVDRRVSAKVLLAFVRVAVLIPSRFPFAPHTSAKQIGIDQP